MSTQSTLAAVMTMVVLSFLLAGGPFITLLSLNNKGLAVEAQQYQYQHHRNSDQHNQYEESAAPKCQPTKDEEVKYDWERYNYYELLGIPNVFNKIIKIHNSDKNKKQRWRRSQGKDEKENQNTSNGEKITTKEIRKAYRKEAQKHHPDKQVSKRKSNTTTTATSNVPTIEESNDRFTKIAEAYEFLSDSSKREEYDLFLEYCHAKNPTITEEGEGRRIASVLRNRFHGLFTNFAGSGKDPFSVFEDFFFGWSDEDEDEDDAFDDHYENVGFDPTDPFSHLHHHSHKHYTNHHQDQDQDHRPPDDEEPIRVFNEQQNMYDPMTGENVIRVLQTEEFAAPSSSSSSSSSSSFYYRIIAQDFKERYDPYHSKQVLVPITDPYLHDDGYRKDKYNYNNRFTNPSSTTVSPNNIESIFHSWEVLTPDSRILMSPNRRYLAGLSPDCELLITTNEDTIIWSSKRPYGSNGYAAHNCFALLEGPHFVVKVGQHHPHSMESMQNQNNRILWHSDSRKDDVDESTKGYYEYEDEYGFWHKRQRSYVAQLDNDGALTVYSVWNVPASQSQQQQQKHQQRPQNRQPKLMATKVVNTAKDIWYGRVAVNKEYEHLYYPSSSSSSSSSSSKSITYKRCIYSTSKFSGCHRLGRLVTQGFFELSFRVNQLLSKINEYADLFLDLIYEDDTVLWELKKSVLRNGNAVGTKMIGSSAKLVRKLLEMLRRLEIHNKS